MALGILQQDPHILYTQGALGFSLGCRVWQQGLGLGPPGFELTLLEVVFLVALRSVWLYELYSKLLKGGYIGDYYRGY